MDAMTAAYDLDSHRFSGDGAWPLRNWEHWPVNPSHPELNT